MTTVRPLFGGRLTYTSGMWEEVGWRGFDAVGVDLYRGADGLGGTGFDIVGWTRDPPLVQPGYVRDERVQARHISELLDVYEAEGMHGAFAYNFIDADAPYSPDPRHDLDMAGFSPVKVAPPESQLGYARTGHRAPKLAFRTLARRYAA